MNNWLQPMMGKNLNAAKTLAAREQQPSYTAEVAQ
jgi:hypothetical protein